MLCLVSRIALLLSLLATAAYANMRCPVHTESGDFFDLSAITASSPLKATVTIGEGEGYSVHFTACGVSVADPRCTSEKSAVCVLSDKGEWQYSAAKFDSEADIKTIVKPQGGVRIILENMKDYYMGDLRVILTLICADEPGETTATITTSVKPAVFNMKSNHPAGCANRKDDSASDGGGSGGLSGGWIFIICLLSTVTVYVVAGCIINWKVRGLRLGKEACPNGSFWGALPGLVKDGAVFTFQKIRACWDRRKEGSNSTYDDVPDESAV